MEGWSPKQIWTAIWDVVGPLAVVGGIGIVVGVAAPVANSLVPDVHRGTIETDQTWTGLHRISGDVVVRGADVHLRCGAHVEMGPGASLEVAAGGEIVSKGQSGCPVVWTTGSSQPEAGDWDGIVVTSGGRLEARHTTVAYAGGGGAALRILDGGQTALERLAIRHAATGGLEVRPGGELVRARGLEFSQLEGDPVRAPAGPLDVLEQPVFENTPRSIVVLGGEVAEPAKWSFPGTTLQVVGSVRLRAVTELTAETSLYLFPDSSITVGSGGALRAVGSAGLSYSARRRWVRLYFGPESRLTIRRSASPQNLFRWAMIGGAGRFRVEQGADVQFEHTRRLQDRCGHYILHATAGSDRHSCG